MIASAILFILVDATGLIIFYTVAIVLPIELAGTGGGML